MTPSISSAKILDYWNAVNSVPFAGMTTICTAVSTTEEEEVKPVFKSTARKVEGAV